MSSDDRIESLTDAEACIAAAVDRLARALGFAEAKRVGTSLLTDYLERHRDRTHSDRHDRGGVHDRALPGTP